MSCNLTSTEYFAMVREEHRDFLADHASIRRAISCCTLMNHVLDHAVSHYFDTDPGKLHIGAGLSVHPGTG